MQGEDGGYFSTQDADSEGVEGKFYVWSEDEVHALLESDAEAFCQAYDVTGRGNWEESNILQPARGIRLGDPGLEARLARCRATLLEAREKRIHPGLDDKILTSWNGLTIIAMARGYRVLGDERFLDVRETRGGVHRALAVRRGAPARHLPNGTGEAESLSGRLRFPSRWLRRALRERLRSAVARRSSETRRLSSRALLDEEHGGFFFTGSDHEPLITRSKSGFDGAIPSGNAVAATYLFELAQLTGAPELEELAVDTLHAFHAQMERAPSGFAQMIQAVDFYLAPRREVVVVARREAAATRHALESLWRLFVPNVVIGLLDPARPEDSRRLSAFPMFEGKTSGPDLDWPRFYLCESYACQAPTDSLDDVLGAVHP